MLCHIIEMGSQSRNLLTCLQLLYKQKDCLHICHVVFFSWGMTSFLISNMCLWNGSILTYWVALFNSLIVATHQHVILV
jgi:hypothetical protein